MGRSVHLAMPRPRDRNGVRGAHPGEVMLSFDTLRRVDYPLMQFLNHRHD
jgi:hypothetical protein